MFSIWLPVLFTFVTTEAESDEAFQAPREPVRIVDLDSQILRQRLVQAYGEARGNRNSKWEVAKSGQTQTWEWQNGEFQCPDPESWNCRDWTPVSFRWWQTQHSWLANWASFRRLGFSLDQRARPQPQETRIEHLLPWDEEDGTAPPMSEDEEELPSVQLGGKRPALETWEWTDHSGRKYLVFPSLRENHWIERIEYGGGVEHIEWARPNRWTRPSIQKVILDRDGLRVTYRFIPSQN